MLRCGFPAFFCTTLFSDAKMRSFITLRAIPKNLRYMSNRDHEDVEFGFLNDLCNDGRVENVYKSAEIDISLIIAIKLQIMICDIRE